MSLTCRYIKEVLIPENEKILSKLDGFKYFVDFLDNYSFIPAVVISFKEFLYLVIDNPEKFPILKRKEYIDNSLVSFLVLNHPYIVLVNEDGVFDYVDLDETKLETDFVIEKWLQYLEKYGLVNKIDDIDYFCYEGYTKDKYYSYVKELKELLITLYNSVIKKFSKSEEFNKDLFDKYFSILYKYCGICVRNLLIVNKKLIEILCFEMDKFQNFHEFIYTLLYVLPYSILNPVPKEFLHSCSFKCYSGLDFVLFHWNKVYKLDKEEIHNYKFFNCLHEICNNCSTDLMFIDNFMKDKESNKNVTLIFDNKIYKNDIDKIYQQLNEIKNFMIKEISLYENLNFEDFVKSILMVNENVIKVLFSNLHPFIKYILISLLEPTSSNYKFNVDSLINKFKHFSFTDGDREYLIREMFNKQFSNVFYIRMKSRIYPGCLMYVFSIPNDDRNKLYDYFLNKSKEERDSFNTAAKLVSEFLSFLKYLEKDIDLSNYLFSIIVYERENIYSVNSFSKIYDNIYRFFNDKDVQFNSDVFLHVLKLFLDYYGVRDYCVDMFLEIFDNEYFVEDVFCNETMKYLLNIKEPKKLFDSLKVAKFSFSTSI